MRRLLYWLGLVDLVWVRTFRDKLVLRIVWYGNDGEQYVYWNSSWFPFKLLNNSFVLIPGGRLHVSYGNGGVYFREWLPYPYEFHRTPDSVKVSFRKTKAWQIQHVANRLTQAANQSASPSASQPGLPISIAKSPTIAQIAAASYPVIFGPSVLGIGGNNAGTP